MSGRQTRTRMMRIALTTICMVGIAALFYPLALVEFPPLVDLPNHLARHLVQCGGSPSSILSEYYEYRPAIVPNMAADLIYMFDFACRDVFLTSRVLRYVAMINTPISALVLYVVLWRKLSVWPLWTAIFALHANLLFGFENFALSAPLAIYLFAFWIALGRRPWRVLVMLPLAFGLYVLHILAFGMFLVLIWAYSGGQVITGGPPRIRRSLRYLGELLLVSLPPLVHFKLLPEVSGGAYSGTIFDWAGRLELITAFLPIGRFSLLPVWAQGVIVATAVLFFVFFILARRDGIIRVQPAMRWCLIGFAIVVLIMPNLLMGVWNVHLRYPVFFLVVFVAAFRWKGSLKRDLALVVALLGSLAVTTQLTLGDWRRHDRDIRELLAATAELPAGSWVHTFETEYTRIVHRHTHSIAYVAMLQPIFTPQLFNGANNLYPKPPVRDFVYQQYFPRHIPDELEQAEQSPSPPWPDLYSHYIVFGETPVDPAWLPDWLEIAQEGSFFTILKSTRPLARER